MIIPVSVDFVQVYRTGFTKAMTRMAVLSFLGGNGLNRRMERLASFDDKESEHIFDNGSITFGEVMGLFVTSISA